MATLQDIQAGLQEASRLATLAKKQSEIDIATGAPQTFVRGTAEPVIIGTPQARREIPNIQQRIQDKTGMMDQRAQAISAPSAPPAPTADEALRKQIEQQSKTPEELDLEKRQQEAETRQRQREASYDSLISINTTAANAQVAQLKQAWQEQRAAVEQANRLTQSVTQQAGIRTGQARYAPEAQAGMMEQEAQVGLKRLQDLDAKYQSAIAEANSAMNQKNWQVAQQKLESLDNFEENITKELQQQVEGARALADKTMQITQKQVQMQQAKINEGKIINLVNQGFTNVGELYNALNYDQAGTFIGAMTTDEIKDIVDNIAIKEQQNELAGLPPDIQKYEYLKRQGQISPDTSYFEFLKQMKEEPEESPLKKEREQIALEKEKVSLERERIALAQAQKDLKKANISPPIAGVVKPLSAEASKVKSIAETLIPEAERLKESFRKDYKGSVTGIVLGTNRELAKLTDNVADKLGRLRSGGAINKEEEKRFMRQIASFRDLIFGNQNEAIRAIDGLIQEANTVMRGITGTSQNIEDMARQKGFNISAARGAGYNEEEITSFLTK